MTNEGLVLLIPAYRPAAALPELITEVLSADTSGCIGAVLIVDDGSGPDFAGTFQCAQADPRVSVIRHATNLGKGAALKTGINYALVTWENAAGIVTADADGQHSPADILRVAQTLACNPERLVLGIRQFDAKVPFRSHFGNNLTRFVFRALTGKTLADTQTGLRGWPRKYCMECLKIPINGYDFEMECLLRLNSGNAESQAILQVPVQTIYLDNNQSSHFNPVLDSMRIYFVFLRYCATAALAAIVDSLTFYLVYRAYGGIALAQVAGRALAVAMAFVLARKVVFKANVAVAGSLVKYLALVVLVGLVSYSMIRFFNGRLNVPILPAKLASEGLLFLGNFAIQRDFIFTRKQSS
jgi:glycosyltransferase involved in cell wall biosynthesis